MAAEYRRKPTLTDMIALTRHDADRATNYLPGRVASGKCKQQTADFELDTREAVIATLNLVRRYETEIRDIVRIKQAEAAELKNGGAA